MIDAPRWSNEQLEADRTKAIEIFRRERMEEPLEAYLEAFDNYQEIVEDLLEKTVDLSNLDDDFIDIVTNPSLLLALRHLPGPPISKDDLKVLVDASLSPTSLRQNPASAQTLVRIILDGLDRRRFPWVIDKRDPTEAERQAAVAASAALIATSRVSTLRRNEGKDDQEDRVEDALRAQMRKVEAREIPILASAPGRGEFCRESMFGKRKADVVVGLWDGRVMPIECKVSNSSTNSVKRLNNDAAVKATVWIDDFGSVQVVPAAVLSGVYKLRNLVEAQNRGLTLFWAHDLSHLLNWVASTAVDRKPM